MMLWEIFSFEISYQSRRVSTWLYFAVLLTLTFYLTSELSAEYARIDGSFANGPFIIAVMTLLGSTAALLIASALAGDAAARDPQTRIAPLLYTTPVGKSAYLGGRFLAAFGLYAVILLAVPLGLLLAAFVGHRSELLGPFRPAAYLDAYLFLVLPNAFVATAVLFSMAALSRRAVVSYIGGVLLLGACVFNWAFVATTRGQWELAKLLDPLGATVLDQLSMLWTPVERSTRLIELQGSFLSNRVLWIGIALGVLTLTHRQFRFAHHMAGLSRCSPLAADGPESRGTVAGVGGRRATAIVSPIIRRTFGFTIHARQVLAIAGESFHVIVRGWGGLVLAATAAFLVFSGTPIAHMGVPLVATTERIIAFLAAPLTRLEEINWIIVPLLIVFYAGEFVWREREACLSEITDAAPVPDWVLLLGKFAGLSLVLVVLQALMMAAGMLTQMLLGHDDFQIALYVRTLFGLQLADWLLFALLALVVHALVNHKYVGHLVVVIAYGFMAAGPALGLEHNLFVYASDPGWTYSDMRGFEPFIGPWLWFKFYWAAWALLLALAATLLWVRGAEADLGSRLDLARGRLTRRAAGVVAAAAALVLTSGGFIFYNTNVLNAYDTASDGAARRAEYERRYGQYKDIPQPRLTGVKLDVEIYPRRRAAEMRGAFYLLNTTAGLIDTVHLATKPAVTTTAVRFDRPAEPVLSDAELGHRIYALQTPLPPGESLRLDFEVHFKPRGFPNRGIDASVVANGTYVTNEEWLPAIGYQADRELRGVGGRRKYGLAARPTMPAPDDLEARHDAGRATRIALDAVVGTDEGQVAVAPGRLQRAWTKAGRRYFHYATDAPIRNDFAFFSAAYAVREGRWNDVSIQILHHPSHAWNADRMVRSVQASLDYYTQQFGPYPHGQLRLVEHPGGSVLLHAAPVNISYEEAFSLLNPEGDARNFDLPFAVVAHEVAHQWWGSTLTPAGVEGAGVLTESVAWYSALQVVERTFGREHLERLLNMMREAYVTPRARADVPLLRADDWFLAYRKGPMAMHALREYIGAERINTSLRRLLERYGPGTFPLPTSLDLYRELQAVTPESLHYLLVDLFEANTFWELATKRVTAEQTEAAAWQVTLDVQARKVVVDTAGIETEVPMDDLIEVGVFPGSEGDGFGQALYRQMHRVRSGEQRITVMVPGKPARAGIDPRRLLIDLKGDDNVKEVTRAGDLSSRGR
jgi:ABC-2 type transport system permease protein